MPAPPSVDLELVATHHKRVVSVIGDSAEPVRHWRLENVTVAHAEATYMDRFEVPSGGDWAVHRGGAFFADGAVDIGVIVAWFENAVQTHCGRPGHFQIIDSSSSEKSSWHVVCTNVYMHNVYHVFATYYNPPEKTKWWPGYGYTGDPPMPF